MLTRLTPLCPECDSPLVEGATQWTCRTCRYCLPVVRLQVPLPTLPDPRQPMLMEGLHAHPRSH